MAAVLLSAPVLAQTAPVEPLPSATTTSSSGSLTYVKGLDHLAELTRDDNLLHPRALAFSSRAKLGGGVMMGGIALGVLIMAGAATIFTENECFTPSVPPGSALPTPICQSHPNYTIGAAGLFTSVVGWLTGLMLMPSRTEWYDIINEWNSRHPDRSLLIIPRQRH